MTQLLFSATAGWGLLGGSLAITCEYLYRVLPGGWLKWLPLWLILQPAIGYCVYRLVTTPGKTLLDAFIIWSFSTILLRVFVTLVLLPDEVKQGTWIALSLMVCARFAQLYWSK